MKTPIRFLLFTLLCVSLFGAAQGQTEYPIGQSLIPSKTRWVAKIDNPDSDMARGRFELYDISSGSPVLLNKDFPVKGMAYSPIRINENIKFARWLSDIFWDNVKPDRSLRMLSMESSHKTTALIGPTISASFLILILQRRFDQDE